ncbi:hypothetical protein NPIL_494041 [Nephila pilipes]|uniref:Uncharacterized protein n=1 Tax=Nephila pilipes TaxID=299642 RepID=A0A8X6Q7A7_NEPPI|nr:hypothetical protein NPIL_494041 [Nephila pilipes]
MGGGHPHEQKFLCTMLMSSGATESAGPPSFGVRCDLLCRWLALGKLLLFTRISISDGAELQNKSTKEEANHVKYVVGRGLKL